MWRLLKLFRAKSSAPEAEQPSPECSLASALNGSVRTDPIVLDLLKENPASIQQVARILQTQWKIENVSDAQYDGTYSFVAKIKSGPFAGKILKLTPDIDLPENHGTESFEIPKGDVISSHENLDIKFLDSNNETKHLRAAIYDFMVPIEKLGLLPNDLEDCRWNMEVRLANKGCFADAKMPGNIGAECDGEGNPVIANPDAQGWHRYRMKIIDRHGVRPITPEHHQRIQQKSNNSGPGFSEAHLS